MGERTLGIGLLGCGIVGSGAARHLLTHREEIARAVGAPVEIRRVAVRNIAKQRDVDLPKEIFTHDPQEVVDDPDVDLVVEVMGGIEPARTAILSALKAAKPVVSANKELMSTLGAELFEAADERGVDLYYEAAVGGGIPLVRPIKESLAGERIRRLMGIVNGTTNYILTRMSEADLEFAEALAEAEALGYAEEDPTADIEGFDAASKTAILASIAFRARVVQGDVYREGISHITHQDIANARRLGYVVKLLAIAEEADGEIAVRVHPAMIPATHPLASVRDSFNAVFVEGESVGDLMFYGRGAGGDPTGSAVVGDVVAAARHLVESGRGLGCTCYETRRIRPIDEMHSQYYVLLSVEDRPGALARVAATFGENGVSIGSVWQEGTGTEAQLVLVSHRAREAALQATIRGLEQLPEVLKVMSVLRVEGEEI
ncbi:MAG TPA: homoserine dehydrogenase [Actinomycetota bacterium]|nr:homoserine dehydrogenase [Actinomycetota bacterium]